MNIENKELEDEFRKIIRLTKRVSVTVDADNVYLFDIGERGVALVSPVGTAIIWICGDHFAKLEKDEFEVIV